MAGKVKYGSLARPPQVEGPKERAAKRISPAKKSGPWSRECPVRPEHKTVYPGAIQTWQPQAAARVWAILMVAGGQLDAEMLTDQLATAHDLSRKQARGVRNSGLTVLEAFGLIEIERLPAERGGRPSSTYGQVRIVADRINEVAARRKKFENDRSRWIDSLFEEGE